MLHKLYITGSIFGLFLIFGNWKSFPQEKNFSFYGFEGNAEFKNNTLTRDQNIKGLARKMKIKGDSFSAEILPELAEHYLIPKIGTKLLLFYNSRLIGVTEVKGFRFAPEIDGTEEISFDVNLEKLNIKKSIVDDVQKSGVLVAGCELSGAKVSDEINDQESDSKIERLSKKVSADLVRAGMNKYQSKLGKCPAADEYKILETYNLKRWNISAVELESRRMCGEGQPVVTFLKRNENIYLFSDGGMRVGFLQYLEMCGRRFVMASKYEDLASFSTIYEIGENGSSKIKDIH